MTKQEMTTLLRSVGVNENTITAMENAYEIGYEVGRLQGMQQERALWELSTMAQEFEKGRQQGMKQERALWELSKSSQEIGL